MVNKNADSKTSEKENNNNNQKKDNEFPQRAGLLGFFLRAKPPKRRLPSRKKPRNDGLFGILFFWKPRSSPPESQQIEQPPEVKIEEKDFDEISPTQVLSAPRRAVGPPGRRPPNRTRTRQNQAPANDSDDIFGENADDLKKEEVPPKESSHLPEVKHFQKNIKRAKKERSDLKTNKQKINIGDIKQKSLGAEKEGVKNTVSKQASLDEKTVFTEKGCIEGASIWQSFKQFLEYNEENLHKKQEELHSSDGNDVHKDIQPPTAAKPWQTGVKVLPSGTDLLKINLKKSPLANETGGIKIEQSKLRIDGSTAKELETEIKPNLDDSETKRDIVRNNNANVDENDGIELETLKDRRRNAVFPPFNPKSIANHIIARLGISFRKTVDESEEEPSQISGRTPATEETLQDEIQVEEKKSLFNETDSNSESVEIVEKPSNIQKKGVGLGFTLKDLQTSPAYKKIEKSNLSDQDESEIKEDIDLKDKDDNISNSKLGLEEETEKDNLSAIGDDKTSDLDVNDEEGDQVPDETEIRSSARPKSEPKRQRTCTSILMEAQTMFTPLSHDAAKDLFSMFSEISFEDDDSTNPNDSEMRNTPPEKPPRAKRRSHQDDAMESLNETISNESKNAEETDGEIKDQLQLIDSNDTEENKVIEEENDLSVDTNISTTEAAPKQSEEFRNEEISPVDRPVSPGVTDDSLKIAEKEDDIQAPSDDREEPILDDNDNGNQGQSLKDDVDKEIPLLDKSDEFSPSPHLVNDDPLNVASSSNNDEDKFDQNLIAMEAESCSQATDSVDKDNPINATTTEEDNRFPKTKMFAKQKSSNFTFDLGSEPSVEEKQLE